MEVRRASGCGTVLKWTVNNTNTCFHCSQDAIRSMLPSTKAMTSILKVKMYHCGPMQHLISRLEREPASMEYTLNRSSNRKRIRRTQQKKMCLDLEWQPASLLRLEPHASRRGRCDKTVQKTREPSFENDAIDRLFQS